MKPRILIVEDSPDILGMYQAALSKMPVEVVAFECGQEALKAFEAVAGTSSEFNLVITDFILTQDIAAQITGIVVAKRVRALSPSCKIVMITGRDDLLDDSDAKRLGLTGLWQKPVDDFAGAVAELLNMPKEETRERRAGLFRRSNAGPKSTLKPPQMWTIWFMLAVIIALQAFTTWRSPRLFKQVATMDKKLDGAVTSHNLPAGYRVTVPAAKAAFKRMAAEKDGSYRTRVTFEFAPKDSQVAESIAADRGIPLWLNVTREK